MADQTVRVQNLQPPKYAVAYEMAKDIWFGSGNSINLDTKDEFLDLVKDCVKALNTNASR